MAAAPPKLVMETMVTKPVNLTMVLGEQYVTVEYGSAYFAVHPSGGLVTGVAVPPAGETTSAGSSDTQITSASISESSGASVTDNESTGIPRKGPTAPSETTASARPNESSKGLSDGAIAGVAIGCLIAGLTLGLVAAFILFRRRRQNNSTSPGFVTVEPQYSEPKHGPEVSVTPSGQDAELSQFLLDATPDKEIQAELSSLSELIYQHAETYYHGPQVQATSAEVAQSLVNIGYSPELSGIQPEAVAAICLDSKASHVGLRHVLSHVIFRGLDFNSGGNLSMLPLAVAALARENHSESTDSQAITLARSRWRSLSALLLHPNPTERTPLPVSTDEAPSKAFSLANKLNTFLQIFVAQDSASRQDQTNHLQAVILECTRLGYVLLSQPGDWGFVFSNKPTTMDRAHMIVVCPGLERLSHNDGTRYRSAKEVAAPETMPL